MLSSRSPALDRLAAAVERHHVGFWSTTDVPRQSLVALDEAGGPTDIVYTPMICFVAGGAKRGTTGERSWLTGAGDMFLNSVTMPVTAVFERVPYRSVVLHLEGRVLSDALLEVDDPGVAPMQAAAPMTPEIIDAVTRWVCLLDAPQDIKALGGRVESEILYRLLTSPLAPALRHWSLTGTASSRIRDAAAWIHAHHTKPLVMNDLAAIAHMSPATLHRHFKTATGTSPLQFQKQLRLQEARRRIVAGDATAAEVALSVGYASATQFNREYRRYYGLPPRRDAARIREGD